VSAPNREGQKNTKVPQILDHDNFTSGLAYPMAFFQKKYFLLIRSYFMCC
jgi:hypothetical protein